MPGPLDDAGLIKLARRLAAEGPHKILDTPKRVRAIFNGKYIVDTTSSNYVWEHPFYPHYYVTTEAVESALSKDNIKVTEEIKDDAGKVVARLLDLHVAGKTLKGAVQLASDLHGSAAELSGLVKIPFDRADQWFEEDTPIFVHPKDPFKRIEIIHSDRPVRVSVDGVELAEASSSMHLYETLLPRRFYLPLTAIKLELLQPSPTKTQCPYKGEAEYYSVVVDGGKTYKDIVWYYNTPTIESAAIAGLACFYNEKVDIEIKGPKGWEKLERPKTHFA